MNQTKSIILLFTFTNLGLPAMAGSIITQNLPANTIIANINAAEDGAAYYNGDQSLWLGPFDLANNSRLPEYSLPAGTYAFRIINPADAAALFPDLTPDQTNTIYSAWTYNNPWITDYLVFDVAAVADHSIPQLFDGSPDPTGFGNSADAYNDAITNGYYNQIRVGSLGRDSTNIVTSYTLTHFETLVFVIPDNGVTDNSGGISVLVTPVAQLPQLSINTTAGNLMVQWPANFTGYTLSQTTNCSPADWHDLTNSPTMTNGNYCISLPMDTSTNRFFRLHNP